MSKTARWAQEAIFGKRVCGLLEVGALCQITTGHSSDGATARPGSHGSHRGSARARPCPLPQDFKGQLWCERVFQLLVVLFGLVGFVFGYIQQDFRVTFLFLSAGGGISALVRAPPCDCPGAVPLRGCT